MQKQIQGVKQEFDHSFVTLSLMISEFLHVHTDFLHCFYCLSIVKKQLYTGYSKVGFR